MNSKSAGIYSITSKINGKRYIGSSAKICDRWQQHLSLLRTNKHTNNILQNHYNKHGEQDLLFAVVEVIDRGELSLQDFKKLLLSKEQTYLDNWNECQFNCLPTAGSSLGQKRRGARYYFYCKKSKFYITSYAVFGKPLIFSYHLLEEEAIKEVEYLKTLTDDELLEYKQECLARPRQIDRDTKNYGFHKQSGKYRVTFKVNGKKKQYGSYETEQEAIDRVVEVRLELGL
jgi:predicted GIY-YIG superfamily endonuclease